MNCWIFGILFVIYCAIAVLFGAPFARAADLRIPPLHMVSPAAPGYPIGKPVMVRPEKPVSAFQDRFRGIRVPAEPIQSPAGVP